MDSIIKINTPHDRYFHGVMSDLRIAREFFQENLPLDIRQCVDLNSLQLRKESFVDAKLRLSITDMLYSVNFAEQPGYLYFLNEHRSTARRYTPLKLWKYMISVMEQHVKETKSKTLPIVYPVIYYNGRKTYPFSTDFFDLFGQHKECAKNILLNPFQLIDLTVIPDEELRAQTWAGIMGFMMKHSRERDIINRFKEAIPLFSRIEHLDDGYYFEITLYYLMQVADLQDLEPLKDIIKQELSSKLGEKNMTIAEALRNEGMEQGMTKGLMEGLAKGQAETQRSIALNLLRTQVPLNVIQSATGLSAKELEDLREKVAT